MAVDAGCEEVEEEGAPQCGDVPVLHFVLNVEPVRLKCVLCARCAAATGQGQGRLQRRRPHRRAPKAPAAAAGTANS